MAEKTVTTHTLSNGLRVVHQHSDSPVMYCGIMVDCGTRDESVPELYGMAHFVEHILFKGTRTRDSWHINNRMESVGGELNAFTTKEETTYYAVGLNKDFARACELICDLLCHPIAPPHELEKEREVVVDEIMSYRDTPSELIYDEFENNLWQTAATSAVSALAHNILGSEATVRTFDHDKCMDFIHAHYTPTRMVFFHQGSTPFDRVIKILSRWFDLETPTDGNASRNASPISIDPLPIENQQVIIPQGTHQAHVLLGASAFPIGHPDAPALALINNMLGGPGMNSRLGIALRERRGLVYTVESSITNYTDAGYLGIYFGCDHDDVKRCLSLCHTQLENMAAHQLSARQLLSAQKQLCGQLGVGRANLENNAIALAKNVLRLGRIESLDQTCQRIQAVTAQQICDVAARVFNPARLATVIIR